MKRILLSTVLAAVTLTATASGISMGSSRTMLPEAIPVKADGVTFREKYNIDRPTGMFREFTDRDFLTPRAEAASSDGGLVTDPQGIGSRYAMSGNLFLSDIGSTHIGGFGADLIISDDGSTLFTKALTLNYYQQGYSAGEVEGDNVVFHTGQYVYDTSDGEKAYMYAAYLAEDEEWPELVDTFVLKKDDNGRYVSDPGFFIIVMTEEEAEQGVSESTDIICFGTNYVFTPLPADVKENKLPADAEVFDCQLSANSLSDFGEQTIKDITIGVSGDNIYIGGLTDYLPGSYLMGTKTSDNTYTFDTHQYLGYFDEGDFPYIYEFAMVNPLIFEDESLYYKEVDSVSMTFNENRTLLTIEEGAGIFICAYGDITSWNDAYWNIMAGDFNQPLTPSDPAGVSFFDNGGSPYIFFEWDNTSVEGIPMNGDNLWCEVIVNGEPYEFSPEYYEGLAETTERVYFNTADVNGLYMGSFSTIYFYEFDGQPEKIKTVGVRVGYQGDGEVKYTDIIYAEGFEPFEDRAFVPSSPSEVVYYVDYSNKIVFNFDGKDIEGNIIPGRLLAIEILLDGEPLVFKDSEYYFNGGDGDDETMIGLSENSINYSPSIVTDCGGKYVLSLWGHSDIPEFSTLAIRPVCIGGDTFTYGQSCEIVLDRPAIPADPWDVSYDADMAELTFGALPIDTAREGLSPWNYGYEVYVNGEVYVFSGELYNLDSDITLVPYEGFEYNYDFYLHSESIYDETTWTIIDEKEVMSISMGKEEGLDVRTIGVRAVYTDGNGHTTYSNVINSDGTVGVNVIGSDSGQPVIWYNLQGIRVASPEPGSVYMRQQGGKITKVYVK